VDGSREAAIGLKRAGDRRSANQGGDRRFESVRGPCKTAARLGSRVQIDLLRVDCPVGMEPFMELSRGAFASPRAERAGQRPQSRTFGSAHPQVVRGTGDPPLDEATCRGAGRRSRSVMTGDGSRARVVARSVRPVWCAAARTPRTHVRSRPRCARAAAARRRRRAAGGRATRDGRRLRGHRWPQPVRGTIVDMCRADHADQAMDMSTFGNSG
jgi:hypothetical protein